MAYRGKYPLRVCSVSSISLFNGLYMLQTNEGRKYTVPGKSLDAVKAATGDYLKASINAFAECFEIASTACERDGNGKPLSVTLNYANGETVTATPETYKAATSYNICHWRENAWQIVNPVPYDTFRKARIDRDALLSALNRESMHAQFEIHSVAVCAMNGMEYRA